MLLDNYSELIAELAKMSNNEVQAYYIEVQNKKKLYSKTLREIKAELNLIKVELNIRDI